MSLKVKHDGSAVSELSERCCLCRTHTRYWYPPKDVALCPGCAKTAKRSDIPTKTEWYRKERESEAREYKVLTYLPADVRLGQKLTVNALAKIVLKVKQRMRDKGFTHAVVRDSQTMLHNELAELETLLGTTP